jgi:type VI secretion system protein ImpE
MNASELFKAAKLQEAIETQTQAVRGDPADQNKRLFLFELLSFAGELDRARRQIEAINYDQFELDTAVASYRKLLDAEEARRQLFRDGVPPKFLSEPPEHVRQRLEAIRTLREQRPAEAAQLLTKANDSCAALKGDLNDKPFDTLRDADDLLAGVLEVMLDGNYYWIPLEQVDTLAANPSQFPRDLLWIPAVLDTKSSGAGNVFLPAVYSGSHEHPDNEVKLGRRTDWKEVPSGPILGVGQKTFLAGDDAIGILEWRELHMS